VSRKIIISIAAVVCALLYISHCFYWDKLAIDDAYITFRYAQNLTDGLGLVYNEGERIEGFSNLSWLLLIAAGMKAGFDPIICAKYLSLLFGLLTIFISTMLARRFAGRDGNLLFLLCPLVLASSAHFCFWTFSGLETVFFSTLIVLSAYLYFRESERSLPVSAIVLSIIAFSRPEGLGYVAVFVAADLIDRTKAAPRRPRVFCFYGILLVSIASLILFKLIYFGSILPNTYYAKPALPFAERNFLYLANHYLFSEPGLLVLLVLAALLMIRKAGRGSLLLWAVLIFSWFFIAHSADWMPNYRFHAHTLPVVAILSAAGTAMLVSRMKRPGSALIATLICLSIAVTQALFNLQIDVEARNYDFETRKTKEISSLFNPDPYFSEGIRPPLCEAAIYLIENGSETLTVAARDVGFIGYISRCTIYDLSMINNRMARTKRGLFRRDSSGEILEFIFGEMKDDVLAADPDVVIYPHERGATTWGRYQKMMFEEAVTSKMEVVQMERKKDFTQSIYAKKESRRFSREELIRRYKRIVEDHPHYPVFQKRLAELMD